MGGACDLVVSGINHGPNLGWDVHYSGTVSAAIEARVIGTPSFAISVASWDPEIHWDTAARFAARLAQWLPSHPLPPFTILNVNVPNVPASEVAGVAVATQGRRQYVDRIERRVDPLGGPTSGWAGHWPRRRRARSRGRTCAPSPTGKSP